MKEDRLNKNIEEQAKKFKLRALKAPQDNKRHDQVRKDEQRWMLIAYKHGRSFANIGSVFGRDPRTVSVCTQKEERQQKQLSEKLKAKQQTPTEVVKEQESHVDLATELPDTLTDLTLAQRMVNVCQEQFAKLRLPSLLRPFVTESSHWVESPYEREIRRHSGHSALVTKVSSSIGSTAEFSQLKARSPDNEIWTDFSEWEKQADSYIETFQKWFTNLWNSVERGVLACYGEPPRSYGDMFDLMIRWADMANKGEPKDALNEMGKGLDRSNLQQFETVRIACSMLCCGIEELPPNAFWAQELDELGHIVAVADSSVPPIPKDFASHMDAEEFWDQVDETKKLVGLARELRQTEAAMIERLLKQASA